MVNSDEAAFLETYDPEVYARPSVTVDVVLLSPMEGRLHTLLVRRNEPPFLGRWALPGGFIGLEESLEAAAHRVLRKKAGLEGVYLEQLYTFGEPGRDPRTRVLSVAQVALVDPLRFAAIDRADTQVAWLHVPWTGEQGGPVTAMGPEGPLDLAFDHAEILGMAIKRLRGKLDYALLAYELLPSSFTLYDLQRVHETVLGRKLNKDSFRRRMLATGHLVPTGSIQTDVDHRPAALYRFTAESPGPAEG